MRRAVSLWQMPEHSGSSQAGRGWQALRFGIVATQNAKTKLLEEGIIGFPEITILQALEREGISGEGKTSVRLSWF